MTGSLWPTKPKMLPYLDLYRKNICQPLLHRTLSISITVTHKPEPKCWELDFVAETRLRLTSPGAGMEIHKHVKFGNKRPLFGLCLAYDCTALKETVDQNKAFK